VRIPESGAGLARSLRLSCDDGRSLAGQRADSPHREAASEAAYPSASTGLRAVVSSRTANVSISAVTGESARHPNASRQLDHKQRIGVRRARQGEGDQFALTAIKRPPERALDWQACLLGCARRVPLGAHLARRILTIESRTVPQRPVLLLNRENSCGRYRQAARSSPHELHYDTRSDTQIGLQGGSLG
jgi:hypothetical protein